jgi:signal transduction histidine kinase
MAPEPHAGDENARLALEAAGEGSWEIHPATGEHSFSARSKELLGLEDDQPISARRLLAAVHPQDRDRWKVALAQVLDAEGTGECYLEFRTAGPFERWLAASGKAFFDGVRAVRVTGTLQDITVAKHAEEERDARLGELGHDLRSPLSAISLGISLVQRDVPVKEKILADMQLMVQRIDGLIDELLSCARTSPGEMVLERRPVPLAGICREVIEEASLAHPGRLIEFERWDDAPGEWDRDRLLLVVRNLLSNALARGAPGEPVVVSVIDCSEEVLLAVANRGLPIVDPFPEHLFDPLRRGAWSGEQIGLFIAKEIVGAHDGRIELTSDDSATVVHVWLPKKHHPGLLTDAKGERA